jgi:hypothetical protein
MLLGFRTLHARGRAMQDGTQLIEGVTQGWESREFAPGGGDAAMIFSKESCIGFAIERRFPANIRTGTSSTDGIFMWVWYTQTLA